jgi:hypothetical protein
LPTHDPYAIRPPVPNYPRYGELSCDHGGCEWLEAGAEPTAASDAEASALAAYRGEELPLAERGP